MRKRAPEEIAAERVAGALLGEPFRELIDPDLDGKLDTYEQCVAYWNGPFKLAYEKVLNELRREKIAERVERALTGELPQL